MCSLSRDRNTRRGSAANFRNSIIRFRPREKTIGSNQTGPSIGAYCFLGARSKLKPRDLMAFQRASHDSPYLAT